MSSHFHLRSVRERPEAGEHGVGRERSWQFSGVTLRSPHPSEPRIYMGESLYVISPSHTDVCAAERNSGCGRGKGEEQKDSLFRNPTWHLWLPVSLH